MNALFRQKRRVPFDVSLYSQVMPPQFLSLIGHFHSKRYRSESLANKYVQRQREYSESMGIQQKTTGQHLRQKPMENYVEILKLYTVWVYVYLNYHILHTRYPTQPDTAKRYYDKYIRRLRQTRNPDQLVEKQHIFQISPRPVQSEKRSCIIS